VTKGQKYRDREIERKRERERERESEREKERGDEVRALEHLIPPAESSGADQWLQRHPEAGPSWPGWPKASYEQQPSRLCHTPFAPFRV